ncbi:monofunctional biosynthetic peptidoglycan transglycosylase [Acidimangrovimonas sediminis]|uniref:monofunctional biosynthetic peptidoglycan transglycosylase n=1 Tax=Acidimangrovimonas sediminis TaxID=2056283 RepID=UPI000C801237
MRSRGRGWRVAMAVLIPIVVIVGLVRFINPPTDFYMASETRRLGSVMHRWTPMSKISPAMARAVVASEDANFCLHWGFDVKAIRAAIKDGANRGASTIDQQVVRNVFLWQGRSWPRKALEAALTPVVEVTWSKRRILEAYLNMAEFGDGVFGVTAAAATYFHVEPDKITPQQAALMASALPDPKERNPARPTNWMRGRAAEIRSGAATIEADGRAACFEH